MNKKSLGLILGLGFAVAANANVIASYNFENTGTSDDSASVNAALFQASSFDVNVTAGSIESGSSIDPVVEADTDSLKVAETQGLANGTGANMENAIATGQYITFSVSAADGYTLDLDSLTFDISRMQRGCKDYAVTSSVDSFTDYIAYKVDGITDTSTTQTIDLSGAAYDSLESVEFRISFDARVSNALSSSAVYVDSVSLNGVSVIPEPATMGMLGFGALALMLLRRRLQQ